MSGGVAYVIDDDKMFAKRYNPAMVDLEPVLTEAEQSRAEQELAASGKGRLRHLDTFDEALLKQAITDHARYTGSTVAKKILENWDASRAKFVKVMPKEYKRALGEMFVKQAARVAA